MSNIAFGISIANERTTIGTQDRTVSSLGSDIISATNITASSSLDADPTQNTWRICTGFAVSSSDQAMVMSKVANNSTATATAQQHIADTGLFGGRLNANNDLYISLYSISAFITDGVTLNYTLTSSARSTAVLLAANKNAANAAHVIVQENQTEGGFTEVAIPFEPSFFKIQSNGDDMNAGGPHEGHANIIIGYGTNDKAGTVKIVCASFSSTYVTGTSENYGIVSDDDEIKTIDPTEDTLAVDGRFSVSFTPTTIKVHTISRTNDAAPAEFSIMLYDLDGHEAEIGVFDTPTSTGVTSLTGGFTFTPQCIEMVATHLESVNTFTNSALAGSLGLCAAVASDGIAANEVCSSVASEQGVSTTDTHSLMSSSMIDIYPDDGSATDRITATNSGFKSGGLDANFTRVATNAKKMIYAAISAEPVSTSIDVQAENQQYEVAFNDIGIDLTSTINIDAQPAEFNIDFFDSTVSLSGEVTVIAEAQGYRVEFNDVAISVASTWADKVPAVTVWTDK